jgi:hypothetical protein
VEGDGLGHVGGAHRRDHLLAHEGRDPMVVEDLDCPVLQHHHLVVRLRRAWVVDQRQFLQPLQRDDGLGHQRAVCDVVF